jgi:hypothetical protein
MFAVPPNSVSLSDIPPTAHPALFARELAADVERWSRLVNHNGASQLIDRSPFQEIWLMSWLPGQRTGLHPHGPTTGAFTVIIGQLAERAPHTRETLVPGQTRVFGPGYTHQLRNNTLIPAVSLHVYRPAITPLARAA